MSRLPAMTYRDVVKRLRVVGFVFDRQAKSDHETGILFYKGIL
jgi:predicted RNA binding protein YcfA (HicA-like mRNA interferase family)